MLRRRMSALAGVLALAIGGLLAFAAPASAGGDHHSSQAVWVTVTGDGTHASVSNVDVHPGWLTLYVNDRTSPTRGAQIVVAKMNRGYPVSRLVTDINAQLGNATPAQAAASTRDINKIAVALGGADTFGKTPFFRSDTIWLPGDGTYYILNTSAANGVDVVGDLEAHGRSVDAEAPDHSGTISLGNGTADTITLRGDMPAKGTVMVRNNGDSVHLLIMNKVADGVTDAQVQTEYDNLMKGIQPTPGNDPAGLTSPPGTPSVGSDAVSPGHQSLLSYNLPKGTYLLQCFVADSVTGIPHTFMGMHLIVHVG